MTKITELTSLATEFRKAIEVSDKKALGASFENFPRGSCGDAALLLGAFLTDAGVPSLIYVCGQRGERSHAWIEAEGTIIDITADQFEDSNARVIVAKSSPWHRIFKRQDDNFADFRQYDEQTVFRLSVAYHEILSRL